MESRLYRRIPASGNPTSRDRVGLVLALNIILFVGPAMKPGFAQQIGRYADSGRIEGDILKLDKEPFASGSQKRQILANGMEIVDVRFRL